MVSRENILMDLANSQTGDILQGSKKASLYMIFLLLTVIAIAFLFFILHFEIFEFVPLRISINKKSTGEVVYILDTKGLDSGEFLQHNNEVYLLNRFTKVSKQITESKISNSGGVVKISKDSVFLSKQSVDYFRTWNKDSFEICIKYVKRKPLYYLLIK